MHNGQSIARLKSGVGFSQSWRRYAPFALLGVALALAVYTLPSSLNLPQANPGQVAEYAPVPGNGSAPPGGNFAGLGLGEGASSEGGAGPPPAGPGSATAESPPSSFECVGSPPRQTNDPLSPPCVPVFNGDNGGATYQGVDAKEVRVVFYFDCCTTYGGTSQGNEVSPSNSWYDLGQAATGSEPMFARVARVFQAYFNSRYQLYKRRAHFFVYYGTYELDSQGNMVPTPQTRAADASEVYHHAHPFAVEDFATGYHDVFAQDMAGYGVLHFGNTGLGPGAFAGEPEAFFQKHPGLVWGYDPSLEQQAALVSSFICQKAVGHPVSFSGNVGDDGKTRRFGLLETTDPTFPDLHAYAELIKKEVTACGGNIADVGTFPNACCAFETDYSTAATNMAQFRQDGVTTVIFGGGLEDQDTQVASGIGYFPEWIVAGDHGMESNSNGSATQAPSEWAHAWAVANIVKTPAASRTWCYQSWSEVQQPPPTSTADVSFGCVMYNDVRQLFIGIQVAGPHLTPASMDQGFHAIPHVASTDPTVPACFYGPGDYNCVKDNVAEWWDPSGRDANDNPGCWRMPLGGTRYLTGRWPSGNVDAQKDTARDACNSY